MDEDLLGGCGLGLFCGAFDEFAADEGGVVADERDEMRRVDRPPAVLGGLDEFECHRQPGGARAGSAGDFRPVPDGGEGGLDRVRGAQVDPVLGGVVVERQQLLDVVGDLEDGSVEPCAVGCLERLDRGLGVRLVLGVPDLRERLLRPWMRGLGQSTEATPPN